MMRSDIVYFGDGVRSSFGGNPLDVNDPFYSRIAETMKLAAQRGMSQKAFRQMVDDFVANCRFRNWTVADVLQHYQPAELHNYDWYMKQLATTDQNPEHFEIFLVDGEKWYCHKSDSEKVKLSSRVEVYRPKRYERTIEPEKQLERSEEDKKRSNLAQRVMDLELENEQLKKDVEYYKLKCR